MSDRFYKNEINLETHYIFQRNKIMGPNNTKNHIYEQKKYDAYGGNGINIWEESQAQRW